MPSSLISNNSMATSQDIGMSQYEMESSGVFSDGDPGRKSSLFIETSKISLELRSGPEPNDHSLPTATVLPELTEIDLEIENQENQFPSCDPVPSEEENCEDLPTPKIEIQSCQSTPKLSRKESSSLNRDVTSRPGSRSLRPCLELVKRPSSQESKGLATKRSELLQEKPIMPNTNVGSKLKEILSRQPTQSGSLFCVVLQNVKHYRVKWDLNTAHLNFINIRIPDFHLSIIQMVVLILD